MLQKDGRLVIEIKNTRPVELIDFTSSLTALGEQYRRFVESVGRTDPDVGDTRLFVHEIRPGSIIAELVPLKDQLAMFAGSAVSAIEFAKDLRAIYEFFLIGRGPDPERAKQDYINCAQILNPVAKDQGSQVLFNVQHMERPEFHLHVTATEAAAIQHRIGNHVAMMSERPMSGVLDKAIFYWYQVRDDLKASAGDRGVIEAVDNRPRKVVFASEDAKKEMLEGAIFRQVYVVDVEVATVAGKPTVYKILRFHERFPRDDS